MWFFKHKKIEADLKEVEQEKKIQSLKEVARKDVADVTLNTKKVNRILHEKSDDIILNIYLATGGDRR